jgi:hypothetical protein
LGDIPQSQDGLFAFANACQGLGIEIVPLLVRTAKWVHPETFRLLPVWYPEYSRRCKRYNATWTKQAFNTKRQAEKCEGNEKAQKALKNALGIFREVDWPNWTCCHIWGVDDPKFQLRNTVVVDPRYYSCIGNMVLLPTPLKALTDCMPDIKLMLRVCAWNLYGWVCDHPDVAAEAKRIRGGFVPQGYPSEWPLPNREILPPGTVPCTDRIRRAAENRRETIKSDLQNAAFINYPRESVREVLRSWNIEL